MSRQIIPGPTPTGDAITALGSLSTNTSISLATSGLRTATLAADITLSAAGMSAARSHVVQVLVTASGARALAFESGWLWTGLAPTALADEAQGLLTLTNADASTVLASWQALGDGS